MSTMLPVLHGAARAISPSEFAEALYAITPPRFPSARAVKPRPVALAISGGVDSMALAYLCSSVRRLDAWLKLADHPVKQFNAHIVDHGLRPHSADEARAVARVLHTHLNLAAEIHTIRWDRELGLDSDALDGGFDPAALPNIETLARRARYRSLARRAAQADATALLLAHHQDDQYETVLMRLAAGQTAARGLRGMRPAADVPECADLHGVSRSGFVDDLRRAQPMYSVGLTRRERRALKGALRAEVDPAELAREMHDGLGWAAGRLGAGRHPYLYGWADAEERMMMRAGRGRVSAPPLEPMDIEDGGIWVYRPLLGFGKDRLVATCLQNGIPWFEDATNGDPTLTMRNAVRHLVRNYELPVALQKPAVLRLAERCRERVAREDAEAERLLGRIVMHGFEPNVGSLVVQLPRIALPAVPRRGAARRREKKTAHYVRIASILVQKLLALVTPEEHLTPLKDLGWVAARLFPSLDGSRTATAEADPPRAFTICGVHVVPLPGGAPLRWHLSRAPHASQLPRPVVQIHKQFYTRRWRTTPFRWAFSRWSNWVLWDNRFWVSLRCRVPFEVTVAPFEPEHAKAFRQAMGPRGRALLDAALRRYAPGKVRYTLPAVYVRGDVGALIGGEEDWKIHDVILEGRDVQQHDGDAVEQGVGEEDQGEEEDEGENKELFVARRRPPVLRKQAWTREQVRRILDEKVRLVALPTLGIGIPGIESWVEWRVRYRKVELETLALAAGRSYLRRERARERIRELRRRMRVRTEKTGDGRGRPRAERRK